MDLINAYFESWAILLTWTGLMFFALGVANGLFFGAVPGLSGSVGIALMIPLVGDIGIEHAIVLFVAALSAQTFSGSVSAILLNTPGTAPNAATMLDGYPMTLQGQAGRAIGISAAASAMGTLIGTVIIVAMVPFIRAIILSFSFPEFALLALVGLAGIGIASKGAIIKGIVSGLLGLGFSFIGFSPMTGELRMVFGNQELLKGVDVVGALIGLYAITEAVKMVAKKRDQKSLVDIKIPISQVFEGVRYVFTRPWLLIKSASIGAAVGIVPAMGGTVAAFMSYFAAKSSSKDPESFGTGNPDGVLAPEAANDAKDAASALPSLAFGVPGSSDWAIILGALVVQGVTPGPMLIKEQPVLMWLAIIVIFVASFATSAVGVVLAPLVTRVTRLKPAVVGVSIASVALVGAYGLDNKFIDLVWVVIFGVLGYFMARSNYPTVPLILGLLLGKGLESNFNLTVSIMDGGLRAFVTRPISLVLISFIILMVVSVIRQNKRAQLLSASKPRVQAVAEHQISIEDQVFAFVVVGGGLFLIFTSMQLEQFTAKLFPLIVGISLVMLGSIYIVFTRVQGLYMRFPGLVGNSVEGRKADDAISHKVFGCNPEIVVLASLVGFLLASGVVGPPLALLLTATFLLIFISKERWQLALRTIVILYVALWLVFVVAFDVKVSFGMFG